MSTVLRRIVLGARWSDEVGSHPGTPMLILLTIIGAVAGVHRDHWAGSLAGAALILAGTGSLWLHGCYKHGEHVEIAREAKTAGGGTGGGTQ